MEKSPQILGPGRVPQAAPPVAARSEIAQVAPGLEGGASQYYHEASPSTWTFGLPPRALIDKLLLLTQALPSPLIADASFGAANDAGTTKPAVSLPLHNDGSTFREESWRGWIFEPELSLVRAGGERLRRRSMHTFLLEWDRLKELRLDVAGARLKVREARTNLKRARLHLRREDSSFEQDLHQMFAESNKEEFGALQDQYKHLQEIRAPLQIQEDEYDKLEDGLLAREWELRRAEDAEEDVYEQLVGQAPSAADIEHAVLAMSNHTSLKEITESEHQPKQYPFLRGQFGSGYAGGQISSLEQRITNGTNRVQYLREKSNLLRAERDRLENEAPRRSAVGVNLDEEATSVLNEYHYWQEDISIELEHLIEEVATLQTMKADQEEIFFAPKNFIGDDVDADSLAGISLDREDLLGDEINDFPAECDVELYPILFGEVLRFIQVITDSRRNLLTMSDYINQWLLQLLCSSKVELRQFTSAIDLNALTLRMDLHEVKNIFIACWYDDGTELSHFRGQQGAAQSLDPSIQSNKTSVFSDIWECRYLTSTEDGTADNNSSHDYGNRTYSGNDSVDIKVQPKQRVQRSLSCPPQM